MENCIKKPLTVLRDEFILKLSDLINNSGVPFILVEPIIKDVYDQVVSLNKQQLEMERAEYEKRLKESSGKVDAVSDSSEKNEHKTSILQN